MAVVSRSKEDSSPRLQRCEFLPATDRGEQGKLLQHLSRQHQLNKLPCISIVEHDSFHLLLVESPEVNSSELKAAMRWRVKDLLPFHVDDAVLDVFDIPGQQERGRPKQMYVVAAKISTIQQHIDRLEENDIRLEVIDIPELALRNISTLLPESGNGVAMLHIRADESVLTICRDGILYLTRGIKLGHRQLSQQLVSDAGANEEEFTIAEVEAPSEGLMHAMDNIVLEVQRSLDYCESHFALPPISGLVLAPMEDEIPHLMNYLASNLGVPVRMLDLNAVLESEQHLDDAVQSRCLLAIGAALRHEEKAL